MTFTTGPVRGPDDALDCLVVGGGPAGLTAALYLARFGRRFALVDEGDPRAAWIPTSHNIPFFAEGIGGAEILGRARDHAGRYGAKPVHGSVTAIAKEDGGFTARVEAEDAPPRRLRARRVLLATGAQDVEPDLPDLPGAIRRGLIRYCPICDGYEARGRRIGVVGHGKRGLGEAIFIARTFSEDVTLMTLGKPLELDEDERRRVAEHRIRVVEEPVAALEVEGDRIAAIRVGGAHHAFDVLYSALGLTLRSGLATALGAECDGDGALIVDDHNQTTIPGLYAAGAIVRGLDQVVVAMGHAAVAATAIHNRCELPTEDEPRNRA
jgi:thioredoxin reductase (NADPH)